MSTESRRERTRRRRGRGFLFAFAGVLAALLLIAGVGAAVTVAQGPRLTDAQVDPAAAIGASGARVILTTTQSLREVDPSQVEVEPAAPFTVDTSGRSVGVRFTLPLRDETDYTVRVRDVRGLGSGPAIDLETDFRTPALELFVLRRGTPDGDVVFRTDPRGENAVAVFTHPHIEDMRSTAEHLVMSVRSDDDAAALVVTDHDGGDERELPLPDDGFVTELQTADRGERIGYVFSDAALSAAGGRDSVLFTASLATDAADDPPTEVALAGGDARVADWRFVPDTDSILVLTFDSRLLLAAPDGSDAAPLGSAIAIDGIARGSSAAIVERIEGMAVIDLTDGSESALPEPPEPIGLLGDVTPVPGDDAGTVRTYSRVAEGATLLGTEVAFVAADGTTTPLVEIAAGDGVLQTCVSPSARYAAVLVSPDTVDNRYDRYLLPLPQRLETRIVELATGDPVSTLSGFGLSWCQVPPA